MHSNSLSVRTAIIIVLACVLTASTGITADLYRVNVTSHSDISRLSESGVDPLMRVTDGYLVLMESEKVSILEESDLSYALVAEGVERNGLAVDISHDSSRTSSLETVWTDGTLRLVRIEPGQLLAPDLAPLRTENIRLSIKEREFIRSEPSLTWDMIDLDSLVGLVRMDSCESYVERLQGFQTRLVGTDSNLASRDWIVGKLLEVGCDSVKLDTFKIFDDRVGSDSINCHNVIGYKTGTVYPHQQIVIGAHRDSYPLESPGADDNGSGTSAVLEIARALSDIDTRVSFVFILFDAEELGLYGSWYYANGAGQRSDNIILMENMDMIAYAGSAGEIQICQEGPNQYGDLFDSLSNALPDISLTCYLFSGANLDAMPFAQNNYEALSVLEKNILPYVHSARDSTTYLDYDYMARVVRGVLATAYMADGTADISPFMFSCDEPLPDMMYPGTASTISLSVESYGSSSVVPGSCLLYYSTNGDAYTSVSMYEVEAGLYEHTLPAFPCNTMLRYYFSTDDPLAGTSYFPDTTEPMESVVGTRTTIEFYDNFDLDKGWVVTGNVLHGVWERVIPDPLAGICGAPAKDYGDGAGYCYLTDNGRLLNVDNGYTILTSPLIPVTPGLVLVEYARWYANYYPYGEPYNDVFKVYVRRDGIGFLLAETVGPVYQCNGGWYTKRLCLNDFFDPITPVQIRFETSDLGDPSHVEAGVDVVKISVCSCEPLIITEQLPDWTQGTPYTPVQLEAVGGTGNFTWTDKYEDLAGTGLTLSAGGLLSGTPAAPGSVSFRAVAADDEAAADEKLYSIQINTPMTIITTFLPDGTAGENYIQQLQASGGTGTKTWSDKNNELSPLGLAMSLQGLLSGTPVDTGITTFTARAEDEVGSLDEVVLTLHIGPAYECGDVDNNGAGVDISDITYFVDWMFGSGPAPPILQAANVDYGLGGTTLDVSDLTYMVDYMFGGGPAPDCE